MSAFEITGGTPLYGSIRLGGAKNASYKLMIASLLGTSESRLLNFSHISDVQLARDVIQSLGGKVDQRGERTLFIDPTNMTSDSISDDYGAASRAASIFIPVLLHRFHNARVPMPGGDKLGKRPLDWHFEALRAMGANIDYLGESIVASCARLKGTRYKFPKNSHTGTETIIMAAVLAQGKTIIENAALEPEIDDLITFLNNMGAHIRRREGKIIEIEGVKKLHGTIHRIMSDRNEAVSYACAAIATKGDIIVENAKAEHLEAFLDKLDEVNAGYEIGNYGIRFFYKGPLKAADIITQPQPGFMTDWQPLWAVLASQCHGVSIIHEAVYPQRFQYLEHLNQMGVKTELFNPECPNPEKTYNFNLQEDKPEFMHAVKIHNCFKMKPITCEVKDLRHGATMVLASMIASGTSRLTNIEQIDRGYEDLDGRLTQMGAHIKRVI